MSDTYSPDNLTLAVMTVRREPAYIHRMLASLFASGPEVHALDAIWIMAGEDKPDYLDCYSQHPKIRVVPLQGDEALQVPRWPIVRRFNHNYHRCLTRPLDGKIGLITCEDDIVFRDGFLRLLLETVREMEQDHGLRDYALALYTTHDFEQEVPIPLRKNLPPGPRTERFCPYGTNFCATQCMYYPRKTAEELAEYFRVHGVNNSERLGDLLVGDALGSRIYVARRSLVQHIGNVSTGFAGAHRSPTFERPWPPFENET